MKMLERSHALYTGEQSGRVHADFNFGEMPLDPNHPFSTPINKEQPRTEVRPGLGEAVQLHCTRRAVQSTPGPYRLDAKREANLKGISL